MFFLYSRITAQTNQPSQHDVKKIKEREDYIEHAIM